MSVGAWTISAITARGLPSLFRRNGCGAGAQFLRRHVALSAMVG